MPLRQSIVTEELLALTEDDLSARLLWHVLHTWGRLVHDVDGYLREEWALYHEGADDPANTPPAGDFTGGWLYLPSRKLPRLLVTMASHATLSRRLEALVAQGLIYRRQHPRSNLDHAYQYRPNLLRLEQGLNAHGYTLATVMGRDFPNELLAPLLQQLASGDEPAEVPTSHSETSMSHSETSTSHVETSMSHDETSAAPEDAPGAGKHYAHARAGDARPESTTSLKEEEEEPQLHELQQAAYELPSPNPLKARPSKGEAFDRKEVALQGQLAFETPAPEGEGEWDLDLCAEIFEGLNQHDCLYKPYTQLGPAAKARLLQKWVKLLRRHLKRGYTREDLELFRDWLLAVDATGQPTCWWVQTRNLQSLEKLNQRIGDGVLRFDQLFNQARTSHDNATARRPEQQRAARVADALSARAKADRALAQILGK